MQAKLFNDPNSGYDVLIASDAVGMGLNLWDFMSSGFGFDFKVKLLIFFNPWNLVIFGELCLKL